MALDFTTKVTGKLLEVTTTGFDESVDDSVRYGEAILSVCEEHQCNRILVDETGLTKVLDTVGQYELVTRLLEKVPYYIEVAMVVNPANYTETSFGSTVATNRGVKIQVFTSADEAREWLTRE
jgi:hypothetical protein